MRSTPKREIFTKPAKRTELSAESQAICVWRLRQPASDDGICSVALGGAAARAPRCWKSVVGRAKAASTRGSQRAERQRGEYKFNDVNITVPRHVQLSGLSYRKPEAKGGRDFERRCRGEGHREVQQHHGRSRLRGAATPHNQPTSGRAGTANRPPPSRRRLRAKCAKDWQIAWNLPVRPARVNPGLFQSH